MLAIKILYKYYLDFRNLITLLFFCMEQGLEFRWIWAILGQISKNSEIKKDKQDLCYYLGSALTLKKVQHCKNCPFIQILACFVPYIYYYLLSFCPWEKEKNLMIRNVFFHSNSFEENTLNFPHTKLFLWASKNLETDLKIQQNFSPDLWSVQKRVLFYASFIMKAYILFTLLPQKKEKNHYFWLHLLPRWWWHRIKLVFAISTQAVDKMLI